MNTTLLWKDWRQNRPVMVFGAIMLALPYVATACHRVTVSLFRDNVILASWDRTLLVVSTASMMLSLVWLAVLGGNALAGERNEQSAQFLAALPVSRRSVMFSRALVALAAALLAFTFNGLVYKWAVSFEPFRNPGAEPFLTLATSGILMLGTAWFFSSFLHSPTIATGLGIAAPFFIAGVVWGYAWLVDPRFWGAREAQAEVWYNVAAALVGLAAFAAGCAHFERRITP